MSFIEKSVVPTFDYLNTNSKCMCDFFSPFGDFFSPFGGCVSKMDGT